MPAFDDPSLYINRELSMLAFQRRVLEEAQDASIPLYERVKFLGIVASNLDEFFMVRVAGVKQQLLSTVVEKSADGKTPHEQLTAIAAHARALLADQDRVYTELNAALRERAGVAILSPTELSPEQQTAAREWFATNTFPALTPLAVDPGHPFPHLRNKSLNVCLFMRKKLHDPNKRRGRKAKNEPTADNVSLAVVQVPSVMSRLVKLPSAAPMTASYLPLEQLIAMQAAELFPGFQIAEASFFRVTRNWDIAIDEEDKDDLLMAVQEELRRRDRGTAVRLEISHGASLEMERTLCRALRVGNDEVFRANMLQLQDFIPIGENDTRPELHLEPLVQAQAPSFREQDSVLAVIKERDVLVHHPFESFDPVVRFIEEAADDPNVLAIKMTMYRTSWNSPFVRALSRAAENGKQVAVLVEIKARFDEANNIAWARRLEEAGVHVVYGLIGLKTHCKVALVVRREGNAIRRYMHLGTGNYNPSTAKVYTDLSYFTARSELADDVSALFNMLTGLTDAPKWKRLAVAPITLLDRLVFLVNREADKARKGEPARIVAKMNALVDPTIIQALYTASTAGVEIDLIVRGMCALRPGVQGVSERIRVTSIVDRFLEHHRIFVFGTGPTTEVYLASSDWMTRNFLRRIETMFPIEEPQLKARILEEIVGVYLADNIKARKLNTDGTWSRVIPAEGATQVRSQQTMMHLALMTATMTSDGKPRWGETQARITLAPRAAPP
jgi:polyphosphate kinase